MVEEAIDLDRVFGALSDPTRRDMVRRVRDRSMSVGSMANHYEISYAGVAKHLEVLERAGLVRKAQRGRERIVSIVPHGLAAGSSYFDNYRALWEERLDALAAYLGSPGEEVR